MVEVVGTQGQLTDLLSRVRARAARAERTLVSAPSKRDAEDVAAWLSSQGVRAGWMHSALDATERAEVLAKLQSGELECLVGVNLLREGLDLPEVSLVAVLGADKEARKRLWAHGSVAMHPRLRSVCSTMSQLRRHNNSIEGPFVLRVSFVALGL